MAKLTLSFKNRKLKVFGLQSGECLIGRDGDCNIPIDSLAVKPRHARVRPVGAGFVLEAASEEAQILLNDQFVTEPHELNEGDRIQIGKHTLSFSMESEGTSAQSNVTPISSAAWLQIHSGNHLGRTIRLDKAFTRIGKPDADLAVIAHREDGYFLSHLQGDTMPQINDREIGDQSSKLQNNDFIAVGELKVQFFADASGESDAPSPRPPTQAQRRFSRISFDVSATLRADQQSWETDLIDISLHGALIRVPEGCKADTEQQYRLAVHLEGGPDIFMDVMAAHQENDELGLRCVDIDLDSITHLRRLVELNLGEPELLERELSALG